MSEETVLFKKIEYDVKGLMEFITIGDIGLPDLQRPFVWSATKVRDLLDSMYRGFPIGYLLLWANPGTENVTTKHIGLGYKGHAVPNRLVIDGQQRLTSLYAVFRGEPVVDEAFEERLIEIAFRPVDGRFEVADAAIRKDPAFISNVSDFLQSGSGYTA